MAELAFTVKEAAKALGVSESAVYWMVYRNTIPHRRIEARGKKGKGKILIPRAALEEWLRGSDSTQLQSELEVWRHRNRRTKVR